MIGVKTIPFECIICHEFFVRQGSEKTCSLKCRLLEAIKEDERGCWIWQKSKNTCGNNKFYGKLQFKNKHYAAHRISYQVFNGEIPEGLIVCHSCDVPSCVNPQHLFVGTQKQNIQDAIEKGRFNHHKRENNHSSRLTTYQVEELKELRDAGFTLERLTRIFNIPMRTLTTILKNFKS